MTHPSQLSARFALRYHVPRSQVWEGSRGGHTGIIHLHATESVTLTAKIGKCGTLERGGGRALCGRRGWYERGIEHPSDLLVRCTHCLRMAKRYGVDWPEVDVDAL